MRPVRWSLLFAIVTSCLAVPAGASPRCHLLGDGVAMGLTPHLDCAAFVRHNQTATTVLTALRGPVMAPAVVSLGNYGTGHSAALTELRAQLWGRVIWVLPLADTAAQAQVLALADEREDPVVDVPAYLRQPDGQPTPAGYRWLARAIDFELGRHPRI